MLIAIGRINLDDLYRSITSKTVLISIMFANNEIGTIQPIKEIGEIAKLKNIIFHTDAVQAVGNVGINVNELNIDALSLSGHKIYAPKGVGALYVRSGIKFERILQGGHQEFGKRSGTENVASIVGLGKAIELIYNEFEVHNMKAIGLRNYYIKRITNEIKDAKINGDPINRLPGNANVSFKDIDASQLLMYLDANGICASAGSACTSGLAEPSHVLVAIGLKEEYINGSIRTTFGRYTTRDDVDYLVDCMVKSINYMKKQK